MPKLFADLSVSQLQRILTTGRPAAPLAHLTDPRAISRARRLAKRQGLWDELGRTLTPAPICNFKRSDFRAYKRVGNRGPADGFIHQRQADIRRAALGIWLGHPKANVDHLQDLLWALCDDFTWVMPAHENSVVDLASTGTGIALAEVMHVLAGQLEGEVVARVRGQIEARVLNLRDDPTNWWRTAHHNWNHVCNGNIVRTALLLWHDRPEELAQLVHRCVTDMQLAIDGFADDGGCFEGPGYWTYGFGHFVQAAYALHAFTAGKVNLMTADPKIERICRYPLAVHIEADRQAPFADTSHAYLPAEIALLINRFFDIPELYTACRLRPDRTLDLRTWRELAMYDGERATTAAASDSFLPQLGLARMRSAPGAHQLTVIAAAGNNGVTHNHNDIGSFIAYRDGVELLTDPGAPIYNSKTFSPRRYEILFCNSLGHSVPLIDGRQQEFGEQFFGSVAVEDLQKRGNKAIHMELAGAYARGTVDSLTRHLNVDYAANSLGIIDEYRFAREPKEVVETFITCEPAKLAKGGKAVRIGAGRTSATLTASQPGRFTIVTETEASKEGRTGKVVKRILFRPKKLAREMTLGFELR